MQSMRILRPILICLCVAVADAAVASCNAKQLPAIEYIDAAQYPESLVRYYDFIGGLIELHGSEEPEKTLAFLEKFLKEAREFWQHCQDGVRLVDKYSLRRFSVEGQSQILDIVERMIFAIKTPNLVGRSRLLYFLDMVKAFFGNDLQGFASCDVTHHTKVHAFLSKYIKDYMSTDLSSLKQLTEGATSGNHPEMLTEDYLEKFVAQDMKPDYTEDQFIKRAQKMDLIHGDFKAKLMLDKIGHLQLDSSANEPHERLVFRLEKICNNFTHRYGRELEIYTWSRLLIPNKLSKASPSKRLPKMAEYWRICLPFQREGKSHEALLKNAKRNMLGFMDRLKKPFV